MSINLLTKDQSTLPSLLEEGLPRIQYPRTYLLAHPGADTQFMRELVNLIADFGLHWTIGGSADDAGIGRLDVRRVIALRPQEWPSSDEAPDLEHFFRRFYPGVTYWPVDWDNRYQLKGRLLAYNLKEVGLELLCPTTHTPPQIKDAFGRWREESQMFHYGLDLTSSWFVWGDEVVSATDGIVVEAGWHGNRGALGYRVRVKTRAPDGREVLIRYARLAGDDGVYVGIGDSVVAGQQLGRAGTIDAGPEGHLHIDVKVGNAFADPAILIAWPSQSTTASGPVQHPRVGTFGMSSHPSPTGKARISNAGVSGTSHQPTSDAALVLLPQPHNLVEHLEWRVAAAIGSSARMWAVGHPINNTNLKLQDCQIIAVNPESWDQDLQTWIEQHSPDADYSIIEAESPWEMAIQLLPPLEEDIALAQTDPRWAGYDFGEDPDVGEETIGQFGCFLTGLAIILRKTCRRDVTPPLLDKLLVAARAAYVSDNIMAWANAVPLFPIFDDYIKDNRARSARELERLMEDGWEIILRRADGGHFVYLETIQGDTLRIIDTWDGVRKEKNTSRYAGIRAAHLRSHDSPPPTAHVMVGLHDREGADWMISQGITGCCLVNHIVQHHPIPLDFARFRNAGITTICRINWGYADGSGTLPRPENRGSFVNAVVNTMLSTQGVDYFHIGNEPNNRQEWPGFGTQHEFPLTPDYVTGIYNDIWQQLAGRAKMGPPPIDPYFGPNSNNRDWWRYILHNIAGADALFLHTKTQTNNPSEVWSRERFSHAPLTWQYLQLRTVETSLEVVPNRFRSLPVFITELNPQFRQTIGGPTGWQPDNGDWVREAMQYFRQEQPVTGVIFYRYNLAGDQAPFGLENKPHILNAIKNAFDNHP